MRSISPGLVSVISTPVIPVFSLDVVLVSSSCELVSAPAVSMVELPSLIIPYRVVNLLESTQLEPFQSSTSFVDFPVVSTLPISSSVAVDPPAFPG